MSTLSIPTIAPRYSFPVSDPDTVWIVRSGSLDLFLEAPSSIGDSGVRNHLLRVEAGQAVFGIVGQNGAARLMANPSPGAQYELVPMRQFQEQLSNGDECAVDLLENWITRLAGATSQDHAPSSPLIIEPGRPLTVPFESKALLPAAGVTWIRHSKGQSKFLGAPGLAPINGGPRFPVSRQGWVESAPRSIVDSIDTRELAKSHSALEALRHFHDIVFECLIQNRQSTADRSRSRLAAKSATDARQMKTGLIQLAAPLTNIPPEAVAQEETFHDPIFLACEAAAGRLGLKLKPHPDMLSGSVSDPLQHIARASGVRVRRVALRANWWNQDGGSMVAFRDKDQSPVALLPKGINHYEVYDPVERSFTPVTSAVAATLNPLAYTFYRPFPHKPITVGELLRFGMLGCRREVSTILWAGVGAGLLGIAVPFVTSVIFDTYIPASERGELLQTSVFLLIAVLVSGMLTITRGFAVLRLEGKMDAAIQAALWDRLLSLPVPFFREYSSGDLALRSLGIVQIRQTLTGSTLTSILAGIFSIFSLVLQFYYSWRLALMSTGLVLFAFLVSTLCGALQVRRQREVFHLKGRTGGIVSQFIGGIAKLRVAGAESRAFSAWARLFSKQRRLTLEARRISNYLTAFVAVYPVIATGVLFYYNAYLMDDPTITPLTTGDFLAFLAAFTQFLTAALMFSSSMVAVLSVVPLYERAQPILTALPEVDVARSMPGKLAGAIEVSNLTFRYKPDLPLVLRGISFRVEPGQFVAFVGASGCGKSTLFRLLLGFESPEAGAIYYDGKDLAGLDVQGVRRQLGVVLQNSRLASGDIFGNIVGSSNLTLTDAWEAAKAAGLEDDVKKMPMGMHTVIPEGGGGLSGGQRQRLLIARAIVTKPRIILFDEATSALDNQTQATVSRSLESLRATRIVIAHRLSTIVKADRIFVLDKGVIVQSGTYDELMEREGLFRELARRQLA